MSKQHFNVSLDGMSGPMLAHNEDELRDILSRRIKDGKNDFYISHTSHDFPAIYLLVSDRLAHLNFVPADAEAGFIAQDDRSDLELSGYTSFAMGSLDQVGVISNKRVITWDLAFDICLRFALQGVMPREYKWFSL